jgi:spectinomycin phosphotransferase
LIVFDFVAGPTGDVAGYDFGQYVELLAHIHAITANVTSTMRQEVFSLPFADEWQQRFAHVLQAVPTTAVQVKLQQLIQVHRQQISEDWLQLLSLSQQCRQATWAPLITHSDAHGGNLIVGDNGELYLIDWDELMLGPAERDIWFHLNDEPPAQDFLRMYRQTFPDYTPNPLFQRFYLFRRFYEDLVGYLIEIADNPSLEHQHRNLVDLERTCFEWLWPLMRRIV